MSCGHALNGMVNSVKAILRRTPCHASALEVSHGQFILEENSVYDLGLLTAYSTAEVTLNLHNLDTQPVVIDSVEVLGQAHVMVTTPYLLKPGYDLALVLNVTPSDATINQVCVRVHTRNEQAWSYRLQFQGVPQTAALDFIADRVYPNGSTKASEGLSHFNLLVRNTASFPIKVLGYKLTNTAYTFVGFPLMPFVVDSGNAYVLGMITVPEQGSCDVTIYTDAAASVLHLTIA